MLKLTDEEAGRLIRYKMFNQVLQHYNANKIAVAHNMNDQTETLLMRICRGTGLRGLTGISAVRGNIIRPLLECSRDVIERYCQENALAYKKDYTNDMDIYTRNKIRIHLIPWIRENLNPAIVQTLSKMSNLLQEEEEYMELQAKAAYEICVYKGENAQILISIEKFKLYHSVVQKRVLRLVLQNFKQDLQNLEQGHIVDVLKLMDNSNGKNINLPYNIVVYKQYENLCFYIRNEVQSKKYEYPLQLDQEIIIEQANIYIKAQIKYKEFLKEKRDNLYTKVFDYDKINDNIKIRTRLSGDKIYLKSIGYKKLKDFFIDIKLPRTQRDFVPLIVTQEDVIWILGYRTSSKYEVSEQTEKILYIEYGLMDKV
jgi:tRNA(Ile)-lysidine synthase